jgi:AAA+ ATPase superfamily predicted ATPase
MVKMTAKNRLKIVKIFNQRNKKKKIMKIYKFSQKKYFLKNILQEGINRFKDT